MKSISLDQYDVQNTFLKHYFDFARPKFPGTSKQVVSTIVEIREYLGIKPSKNLRSKEVVSLVRRMSGMRIQSVRRFTMSMVPGILHCSKKSYYINHLCYTYGSAIGYWSGGIQKNWIKFLCTPLYKLNDPYSTSQDSQKKKKSAKKQTRKKRVTIYTVMEAYFIKGGTMSGCLNLLMEEFPHKGKITLKKTIKMYIYKFIKIYNITKKDKIIKFVKE